MVLLNLSLTRKFSSGYINHRLEYYSITAIPNCLEISHQGLYDWLKYLDGIGEVKKLEIKQWNKNSREIYSYQYVNRIPLRDSRPAIKVNWCNLIHIRESDRKILYENAFITHHELTKQSVPLITAAGQCRWKTENENHNVLKTKGYHLEHNFGYGQEHLASCLLTLNLLAFLFHTVLYLTDLAYQQIRHKRGTRKGFFQDILSLTKYLLFESWPSLIDFMLYGSKPNLQTTPPNFLNLELLVGNINGTGSSDNNTIIGYGIGDNIIDGGAGNDTFAGNSQNNIFNGGSGNDTFVFGSVGMTTLTQLGIDSIADFTVGQDKIQLSESIFHIPAVGINNFIAVADDAAAATATATIVYSKTTGNLFYNSGIATSVQFAQLGTGLTLSQNYFLVSAAMVV